mgnify:CR=1 FL=1
MSEKKYPLSTLVVSFLGAGGGVVAFRSLFFPDPVVISDSFQQDDFNSPVYIPVTIAKPSEMTVEATASIRTHLPIGAKGFENGTGVRVAIFFDGKVCQPNGKSANKTKGPVIDGYYYMEAQASCEMNYVSAGNHSIKVDAEFLGSCLKKTDSDVCKVKRIRGGYTAIAD